MNIQEELLKQGAEIGMCEKFVQELSVPNLTEESLCRLFHRGQDFCIEHNFPSVEFMREHIDDETLCNNGIIVRDCEMTEPPLHVVVLEDNLCIIKVPDNGVCDITLRDNSECEMSIGNNAVVYVSIYSHAQCKVLAKGTGARISASQYGGTLFNEKMFDKITKK